jgi:hypothetical protein
VELTAADFERIPHENLRVPRDEFVAVWVLAEGLAEVGEWYDIGVAFSCRWIACAHIPALGRSGWLLARAPLTEQQGWAEPESIEAEAATADRWLAQNANGIGGQPGFLEGVAATLEWVWRGNGHPPLDIRQTSVG